MRIAIVCRRVHPAHGPGGMERLIHAITREVARRGILVDLVVETPGDPDRLRALVDAVPDGVTVHAIPGRWLPIGDRRGTVVLDRITNYMLWVRRVGRWFRTIEHGLPSGGTVRDVAGAYGNQPKLDLIHASGLAGWGFTGRNGPGVPMLLWPHGLEEFQVPPGLKRLGYLPFRRAMRRAAKEATRVVTNDNSLVPVVERYLGIPADEQIMIPNAVDPDELVRSADPDLGRALVADLGLAGSSPLFLSVGRLVPNKGFNLLVKALARGAGSLPDGWGWVLVGDGPTRGELEEEIGRAGIGGRVALAGRLEDVEVRSLAAVADWFVHPTLYEGASLVTLEAMAHGLPVIASRAGGIPDKVVDGSTGFLVPPGDVEALAGAVARAAGIDGREMGRAGRRLCEERFSWSVVGDRYAQLYRRVAGRDR